MEEAFCNGWCWRLLESLWEKPIWEGVWAYLDPMDSVCLRTASMAREVRAAWRALIFLIQKELATVSGSETFSPFFNADNRTPLFSADVLKKCALLALHLIAEEESWRWISSPGSGDEWEMGCPKIPMRESEGKAWSEDVCLLMTWKQRVARHWVVRAW